MPDLLDAREPLPFERLFLPLVLDARGELRQRVEAGVYNSLTPAAHNGWERYLLSRLSAAGAKAAHWQFQVFKTVRRAFPKKSLTAHRETDAFYREFVGERPQDRLQKLFVEFPTLAQLCGKLIKNWLSAVVEFLSRFDTDRHELGTHFNLGQCICPVLDLQAGLSDPHHEGRCVARLHFQDRGILIYKPRSLAPEAHFYALLEQFNVAGIPHRLRVARCWDRGEYGWMENIESLRCITTAAVRNFYWSTGVLLGICYLAHGVDLHQENMIAAGEQPVLIDLEALGHFPNPQARRPQDSSDLILRTGFLPRGIAGNGRSYEWGALSRKMQVGRSIAIWVRVNQDDMALQTVEQEFVRAYHLPVLNGARRLASEFVPEVQAGFRWVGKSLLDGPGRREVLAHWIRVLADCPRRQILRPTVVYQEAIGRCALPELLRGAPLPADLLPKVSEVGEEQRSLEYKALEQLDVPYFRQNISENKTTDSDRDLPTLKEYLRQSALIAETLVPENDPRCVA